MWHPKPERGITQPSSRFAFYNVMTSSSSSSISPSTTISLVALVRHWEKVGKASKQSIKQDFDSMTTTAQWAAVVKNTKFSTSSERGEGRSSVKSNSLSKWREGGSRIVCFYGPWTVSLLYDDIHASRHLTYKFTMRVSKEILLLVRRHSYLWVLPKICLRYVWKTFLKLALFMRNIWLS